MVMPAGGAGVAARLPPGHSRRGQMHSRGRLNKATSAGRTSAGRTLASTLLKFVFDYLHITATSVTQ
jgi:hypothetical protein